MITKLISKINNNIKNYKNYNKITLHYISNIYRFLIFLKEEGLIYNLSYINYKEVSFYLSLDINNMPLLKNIIYISKPSKKVYIKKKDINKNLLANKNQIICSNSLLGYTTLVKAKYYKVGGKLLFRIIYK